MNQTIRQKLNLKINVSLSPKKNLSHESQKSDSSSELTDANVDRNSPRDRLNIFAMDKEETEELTKKSQQKITIGGYITGKFNKNVESGQFHQALD